MAPENVVERVAAAAATARARDAELHGEAHRTMRGLIAELRRSVQQVHTAKAQRRWLVGADIGGLLLGMAVLAVAEKLF